MTSSQIAAMATNIFEPYLSGPVTAKTYKELGQKLQQYSSSELEILLKNFEPHELHYQLLKLTLARTTGYQQPLLDGLKSECKYVSHFCVNSRLLYCGGDTVFLNSDFLIPLLQTVSASIRNKILWNIGKYLTTGKHTGINVADVDALYMAVSRVWGSNIALPILCQTSEEMLEQELPQTVHLSNVHLLIIARKYPYMAFSYLQQLGGTVALPLLKAARFIVRQTLPHSLDYIKKQHSSFLSKSAMKSILHNYLDNILAAPSSWLNVLDEKVVKKNLKPDHFKFFLFKQLIDLELDTKFRSIPYNLEAFLELLTTSEFSDLFNKVFQEKYGCNLRSKIDFWEKQDSLMRLLEAGDRSFIAVELDAKSKPSNKWLPFMTTDLSFPRIKKLLSTEQNHLNRSNLLSLLIASALMNKDQNAIEEICTLVVNRYRNDKGCVGTFFGSSLDFLSFSPQSFDLVLALAKKFYEPNVWQTRSAAAMFAIAIQRNWSEQGLKEYIDHILNDAPYFNTSDLKKIGNEFHLTCVNEVFTAANIENKKILPGIASFLPLITKWMSVSSVPLITDNVKKSVLVLLKLEHWNREAIAFVCTHLRILNFEFIEKCFMEYPHEKIFAYLFKKKSHLLSTQESMNKLGSYIIKNGVRDYASQLRKLKKLGYLDMLHSLSLLSKQAVTDASVPNCTNAVILLMLTASAENYFSCIDPLLPNNESSSASAAAGEGIKLSRFSPFNSSKREDSIYFGFGLSLSHLAYPSLAIERLSRFCVSGDLILFVRDSVYSVSNSLPNETAKVFLLTLMEQPVSVKKHSLRLLWRTVCNIETQEQLLGELMESEKHLSIRIILMDTAMALLNLTKTDSLWNVVKKMIEKLTADDQAIITSLIRQRVPDPFLEEYFKILLEKCKTLQNVNNHEIISNVLDQLCQYASLMSEKFIENIISEYFFSTYNCVAVLLLFTGYLQGVPASKLPVDKNEPLKNLESRQQFLQERLNTCVVDGPLDVFDAAIGQSPVRRQLMEFVSTFCRGCLNNLNKSGVYQYSLTDYIEFLLSYFSNFNQNAVFCPYIFLSLTKICTEYPFGPAVAVGEKIGDLSDCMLLKHSPVLLGFYPQVIRQFINSYMMFSPCFSKINLIDVLNGMLSPITLSAASLSTTTHEIKHLLRLMIVAHMLPSQWYTEDKYRDFTQTFLVLIKNTPIEVFLFDSKF